MRGAVWTIIVLNVLLTGCALAGEVERSPSDAGKGKLTVVVADTNGRSLEGVEVVAIGCKQQTLGRTDALGRLAVDVSLLRSTQVDVLLFCDEYFFCGAMRVNEDLLGYTERYIELAPMAMR